MNNVVLIGRLARNPEMKYMPSGMAVVSMTMAIDRELSGEKKQEAINNGQPTVDFIPIKIFGKIAENANKYLKKGNMCAVSGRITTNSYTTPNGEKRKIVEILASRIEFLSQNQDNNNEFTESDDEFAELY